MMAVRYSGCFDHTGEAGPIDSRDHMLLSLQQQKQQRELREKRQKIVDAIPQDLQPKHLMISVCVCVRICLSGLYQ